MTITLYILGWLLSGFLAAWLLHKYVDTYEPVSNLTVIVCAVTGIGSLILIALQLAEESKFLSQPFFKAKEPK